VTTPLVGVDSFSYHRWFGEHTPWETPLDSRRDAIDVLDLATGLGLDTVSLQTIHVDAEAMGTIAPPRSRETWISSSPGGIAAGWRAGRTRRGWPTRSGGCSKRRRREPHPPGGVWRPVVVADRRLAPAGAAGADARPTGAPGRGTGVALAIENHADLTIEDIVTLIDRVGAPDIGICFDLGNAVRVGEDVVAAALLAAPYVRMVHAKDIRIQPESLGDPSAWWPTCPLGRGDLPVAEALRATLSSPHPPRWYVEMATMHPDHPDEDAAVSESVVFLRAIDRPSSAAEPLDGE
jgi:3-oxoisoapionate decarboxylase